MIQLGDLAQLSFNLDLMEEDKKIKIFDNKVSFKTRQEIYNSAHNSFYKLGWEDAVQKESEPNLFSEWSINDLSKENGKNWLSINGGAGTYNAERYINNYVENWTE